MQQQKAASEAVVKKDTTWTDEEIKAAFHFIDLDKNNFIGAAELRHCLICMGELITDEEVDMMINLVDEDGDGQVETKHPFPVEILSHLLAPQPTTSTPQARHRPGSCTARLQSEEAKGRHRVDVTCHHSQSTFAASIGAGVGGRCGRLSAEEGGRSAGAQESCSSGIHGGQRFGRPSTETRDRQAASAERHGVRQRRPLGPSPLCTV
eukprot:scaffold890_cov269-Pinguiococcus_pyrenoidosus.AAC.4